MGQIKKSKSLNDRLSEITDIDELKSMILVDCVVMNAMQEYLDSIEQGVEASKHVAKKVNEFMNHFEEQLDQGENTCSKKA